MPNKEVNNITLEIGNMIETYDLTDSNNPVIEIKDTVTENATAGTEQHVFKETTADGHENQVSDFLIAQKQISSLRTNSTGDGLVMESYDQKATHQQTDLRLAQVTTNKNNIARANTNIQKNAEDIATANTNIQKNAEDIESIPFITNAQLTTIYAFGFTQPNGRFVFIGPITLPKNKLPTITLSDCTLHASTTININKSEISPLTLRSDNQDNAIFIEGYSTKITTEEAMFGTFRVTITA